MNHNAFEVIARYSVPDDTFYMACDCLCHEEGIYGEGQTMEMALAEFQKDLIRHLV